MKANCFFNIPARPKNLGFSEELIKGIVALRSVKDEFEIKEIEKVTPGDIKEVGDEIFMKNKLNLAVISPYHRFKHFSI